MVASRTGTRRDSSLPIETSEYVQQFLRARGLRSCVKFPWTAGIVEGCSGNQSQASYGSFGA